MRGRVGTRKVKAISLRASRLWNITLTIWFHTNTHNEEKKHKHKYKYEARVNSMCPESCLFSMIIIYRHKKAHNDIKDTKTSSQRPFILVEHISSWAHSHPSHCLVQYYHLSGRAAATITILKYSSAWQMARRWCLENDIIGLCAYNAQGQIKCQKYILTLMLKQWFTGCCRTVQIIFLGHPVGYSVVGLEDLFE